MDDFHGKIAVITGAGSGLGREFARLGAALGMKLVLADVQADALDATAAELTGAGAAVQARRVDVADGAQVEALAEATVQAWGVPHLLFNNAGVGTSGLLWESSERDWAWTLGVNLWGVIHGIRAFVPRMLAAGREDAGYRAHVVNTASMAGLLNPPLTGVYNASKHAVVSLTETLYHDLALVQAPVGCSVLCPFYVPTGIHESARNRPEALANTAPPTAAQRIADARMAKAVGGGRVSADEVARMAFDAVREGRFYIASHPQALDGVRVRAEDIVQSRNPTDPFQQRPAVRDSLRAAFADATPATETRWT
jgi:NAD(P)-dependent dehydrogenase (short-subunit alcohol dehydrogenase family)